MKWKNKNYSLSGSRVFCYLDFLTKLQKEEIKYSSISQFSDASAVSLPAAVISSYC